MSKLGKTVLTVFALLCGTASGKDLSREPVKVIAPASNFLGKVSPVISRLQNVKFFEAGALIGIYGENPNAKTEATKPVVMFFDDGGEVMAVGQVVELATRRNFASVAIQQFAKKSELTDAAKASEDEADRNVKALSTALEKDIAEQNKRMQERNSVPALKAGEVIEGGLTVIKVGNGERKMVAFIDLGCEACVKAARDLISYIEGTGKKEWTIGFALMSNPKDSSVYNTTAAILDSEKRLQALKAVLDGKKIKPAGPAGRAVADDIFKRVSPLGIKTYPYFVISADGNLRDVTGYSNIGALIK